MARGGGGARSSGTFSGGSFSKRSNGDDKLHRAAGVVGSTSGHSGTGRNAATGISQSTIDNLSHMSLEERCAGFSKLVQESITKHGGCYGVCQSSKELMFDCPEKYFKAIDGGGNPS